MGDRRGEVQVEEVLEVEARAREGAWRRDRRDLGLGDRFNARSEVRSRHGWILVEIEDDGWYKPTISYEHDRLIVGDSLIL